MRIRKLLVIPLATMLTVMTIGCDENENKRLAEMAQEHLENQVEQNRRMADLQEEVAEGSRRLVEADADARKEMVALQREMQAERTAIGRQRDVLEGERRDLAAKRHLDPIIAAALTNFGLLLACLLPLVLCWHLLRRPSESADDHAVAEVLIEDLLTDRPLLLSPARVRRAIRYHSDRDLKNGCDISDHGNDAVPPGSG